MATRLDRLFVLLDSGSSNVTRKAAAKQLGEVQRLHPYELPKLLLKLLDYIHSQNWDTRVAASQAIEAVLVSAPKWTPSIGEGDDSESGKPVLVTFDIAEILAKAASLDATVESKFSIDIDQSADFLGKQTIEVNKALGTDSIPNFHIEIGLNVTYDDLKTNIDSTGEEQKIPVAEMLGVKVSTVSELSGLKRKMGKGKSNQDLNGESASKRRKEEEDERVLCPAPDVDGTWGDVSIWPFEDFYNILIGDLFSPHWEVRHGAASALRELLKTHGSTAGMKIWSSKEQMAEENQIWLENCLVKLVCVLALDRFGDFVGDQVVAPVRESTAQAIGTLVTMLTPDRVKQFCDILLKLLDHTQWEARHGGVLGLKYILAVRKDILSELLPLVYPAIFKCLSDSVDDVSGTAAASLSPFATSLVTSLDPGELNQLTSFLWESLKDLDDLSASTGDILCLLASLATSVRELPLATLVPRLWPFLYLNQSGVRRSALKTLRSLVVHLGAQGDWLRRVTHGFMRQVFQRAILEHYQEIIEEVVELWSLVLKTIPHSEILTSCCPCVAQWLCLLMQPARVSFDPSVLEIPLSNTDDLKSKGETTTRYYLAGSETAYESRGVYLYGVMRARLVGAKMLGTLAGYLVEIPQGGEVPVQSPVENFINFLLVYLSSRSSVQRTVTSHIIREWISQWETELPNNLLQSKLYTCLVEPIVFDEISVAMVRLIRDAKDFISTLRHYALPVEDHIQVAPVLTVDQIQSLVGEVTTTLLDTNKLRSKPLETIKHRRSCLETSLTSVITEAGHHSLVTEAALSGALISLRSLPEKLNPVVKPQMEVIKTDTNVMLQRLAAESLARLIDLVPDRNPCPTPKILKNVCLFLCSDPAHTPQANIPNLEGCLTLEQLAKSDEKGAKKATPKKLQDETADVAVKEEQKEPNFAIQRRGGWTALQMMASHYGDELPVKIPSFWEMIARVGSTSVEDIGSDQYESCITNLQVVECVAAELSPILRPDLQSLISPMCHLLSHLHKGIRHMAGRALASVASVDAQSRLAVIDATVSEVLPGLSSDNEITRLGCVEAIYILVNKLEIHVVPFVALLVIPILARMSDLIVRDLASQCFASLVRLMPLDSQSADEIPLPRHLEKQREHDRKFLMMLMDPKKIEKFNITVNVEATLRPYQQEGVCWLAFLRKYNLHGILCDDMGLGKTLQTICILASEHSEPLKEGENRKVSLVVCPPTLTGHWVDEIGRFVHQSLLDPMHYAGPPSERQRIWSKLGQHNIVVASYDIVRIDFENFKSVSWDYLVLDEGHVIKNGKTKVSQALKRLRSKHRLILSGTPIQNNVLELWSLFDFLMPGFLGSERNFNARFSKPIIASREAKANSKEQEQGAMALEALHRQTLPFLLRRMKEDVLKDLPPKIVQDYYCELSPLQHRLYESFAKSSVHKELQESLEHFEEAANTTHVFQALQYLRKVCNHPKLVLTAKHPDTQAIESELHSQGSTISDIKHSAKLLALKQLLIDCGIGTENGEDSVVAPHRALIFCQLKSMLDIIEKDVFKKHLPSVSFLRLDGSVPANQRQGLVNRFNEDPSIDVLLLTTQVGGLGLNLTGADTVIFVEHDWNPQRDLQAMDRAHRIGQKRVVNVYRLITHGTLEERIMGLQKFKLATANTIITAENASLETMGTNEILDLFTLGNSQSQPSGNAGAGPKSTGLRIALESLPELWSEEQYDSEYNLGNFLQNLKQ